MAWTFDAPGGVYKDHTISNRIRYESTAKTVFFPFLNEEREFGRKKGQSFTITRFLQLPVASRVGETDRLPAGRPPIQTNQITVSEWGFKVPMTVWENDLGKYDLPQIVENLLRDQMRLTLDNMAAEAFKATPIKYVPLTTGFNLDTDGSATGVSDRNLSVDDLREIYDYMSGTLKVPTINGKYIGILSPKAARGIKNDPTYRDWIAPTSSAPLMNGELKDIEGFRLIESNNFAALDNTVGTSVTTGEAIFFGADAAGLLEIQAPELRVGVKEDLGRFYDIGWVGKLEAFHTWPIASMARAVHVTSN